MFYNPQTYHKKKRRTITPYILVFGLLIFGGFVIWKGEQLYYQFIGNKGSKLSRLHDTFYARLEGSGQEVGEPLNQGLQFIHKMIEVDQANTELHYYRGEFHYLRARLDMRLDDFKIVNFAARPDGFKLSKKAKKYLFHAKRAALKSLALEPEHKNKFYAHYVVGIGYLFGPAETRKFAYDHLRLLVDANFQAEEKKFFATEWPLALAAMLKGQGGLATDSIERAKNLELGMSRELLRALVLFYEKRYTDCLIAMEKIAAALQSKAGPDSSGEVNFFLMETYRYLGKVYRIQNLNKKSTNFYMKAYAIGKHDEYLVAEMEKLGILTPKAKVEG